jgi:tetratricopeptide (TPR) repeat protein
MIARDAESTIGPALDSVRSIADEIIVVDTGSIDRTPEIAQRRATKLIEHPWSDDFSEARNFALSQLKGDWVLWLDAGEQLDPKAAKEIRAQIDAYPNQSSAFLMLVQLPPAAGQIDGEQIGKLRLWPTRSRLKFAGKVREQLLPTVADAGLNEELTTWRIRRPARDVDFAVKAAKANRDLRLAEFESLAGSDRPELNLVRGEAWMALGDPLKAAGWFRQVIDESPRASTTQLEAFYGLLTTFDSRPGTADQQVATCVEALDVFPLDAQLLCAMGSYMQNQGRVDLASRCYQTAVEHGQVNLRSWHLASLMDIATICYCLTLELQNRTVEARRVLETGLAARPDSIRLRRQLIDLHIKHNRRQEALGESRQLAADLGVSADPLRTAIRGACLAADQQWTTALAHLRSAHESGCRDPICLRWLASSLIASGDMEAARPILQQWLTAAPESPEPARLLASLAATDPIEGPASRMASSSDGSHWRADHSAIMAAPAPAPRFIDASSLTPTDFLGR